MDKGLAKINTGQGDFDLLVGMNVWAVGRSIAAGLAAPDQPRATSPTSPPTSGTRSRARSTTWTRTTRCRTRCGAPASSGATTRSAIDIAGMANPYDIFWDSAPSGQDRTCSRTRRTCLRCRCSATGITDVNVTDAGDDHRGEGRDRRDRERDERLVRPRRLHRRPEGAGVPAPVVVGQRQRRRSCSCPQAIQADNLSYVWPVESGVPGNVDNDTIVLLKTGKAPVLAHLLLNHILDSQQRDDQLRRPGRATRCRIKAMTPRGDGGQRARPRAPGQLLHHRNATWTAARGSSSCPATADALWQAAYAELTAGV